MAKHLKNAESLEQHGVSGLSEEIIITRCIFFFLTSFLLSSSLLAQTRSGLERLNFFPDARGFVRTGYLYQFYNMETPEAAVMTKEVNTYSHLLSLSYGQCLHRRLFLGASFFLEQAHENGVRYGVPLNTRFNSFGPKEPELFLWYRLREQRGQSGLFDMHLSLSPEIGAREIGEHGANRLNGRNILRLGLFHGLWEEDWEFRSSLQYIRYGEGKEVNNFSGEEYILKSYADIIFQFLAQYSLEAKTFLYAGVGVNYRSTQDITSSNQRREIQAGTGSIFDLGVKRSLSQVSLIELSFRTRGNDYFVKAMPSNIEGEEREDQFGLNYIHSF